MYVYGTSAHRYTACVFHHNNDAAKLYIVIFFVSPSLSLLSFSMVAKQTGKQKNALRHKVVDIRSEQREKTRKKKVRSSSPIAVCRFVCVCSRQTAIKTLTNLIKHIFCANFFACCSLICLYALSRCRAHRFYCHICIFCRCSRAYSLGFNEKS